MSDPLLAALTVSERGIVAAPCVRCPGCLSAQTRGELPTGDEIDAGRGAGLFPDLDGHWFSVSDADPRAVALYSRHYSADRKHISAWRNGIGGPGQRTVLLTADARALFVWRTRPEGLVAGQKLGRHGHYGYDDGQRGVMCSVFRNEGPILSSELIREACDIAWRRWPGERLFTYVWDAKVASENPGACYRHAGWTPCGRNADGRLTILERVPIDGNPSSSTASGYCTAHRGAECSRCRSIRLAQEGSHDLVAAR